MKAKLYFVFALGAAILVGGITTVSALGMMNGECITDQLRDGTGDNCPNNEVMTVSALGMMNGECIMDQLRDGTGDNCPDIC